MHGRCPSLAGRVPGGVPALLGLWLLGGCLPPLSTPGVSEHPGDVSPIRGVDGASSPDEPGDLGASSPEDGLVPDATSSRLPDASSPTGDSGATPGDTGTPPGDTGATPGDTGTPPGDTGTPPEDAGPPPEVCNGQDDDGDGLIDEICACQLGQQRVVDNDRPGSGYREVNPDNWKGHSVDACAGTYRYLTHTQGDGSRRGQAIWQPTVATEGWYRVVTSFRATENRTDGADYVLHDDQGGQRRRVVDQRQGSGCTRLDLGLLFCRPGGSCRLILAGEDGESAAADETRFTLERCAPPDPIPGRCAGIAANPAYELCVDDGESCQGVYPDGAGCERYCAAAGLACAARFGGEPGCSLEADLPIPCAAVNGHLSDWCVCR